MSYFRHLILLIILVLSLIQFLQISAVSKSCLLNIRVIRRIHITIDQTTAYTIDTFLINSKIDYCNSLLLNLPATQTTTPVPQLPLSGIVRVTTLKILGYTVTNRVFGRPCTWHHHQLRTDPLYVESLACTQHVWLYPSNHVPVSHDCQTTVRIQCLVVLHKCVRQTWNRRFPVPWRPLRQLPTHPTSIRRALRRQWTGKSSIRCSQIPTICIWFSPTNYSSKLQHATSQQTGHVMYSNFFTHMLFTDIY